MLGMNQRGRIENTRHDKLANMGKGTGTHDTSERRQDSQGLGRGVSHSDVQWEFCS